MMIFIFHEISCLTLHHWGVIYFSLISGLIRSCQTIWPTFFYRPYRTASYQITGFRSFFWGYCSSSRQSQQSQSLTACRALLLSETCSGFFPWTTKFFHVESEATTLWPRPSFKTQSLIPKDQSDNFCPHACLCSGTVSSPTYPFFKVKCRFSFGCSFIIDSWSKFCLGSSYVPGTVFGTFFLQPFLCSPFLWS